MRNPFHSIVRFFDRLEDHNRAVLSHYPILYAIIGGFGIVQYWRGVWHLSDNWGWSATTSIIVGLFVLLITGLLVSFFIGDNIILTGIKREKKLVEKTEDEIKLEEEQIVTIKNHLTKIDQKLEEINSKLSKNQHEDHHS